MTLYGWLRKVKMDVEIAQPVDGQVKYTFEWAEASKRVRHEHATELVSAIEAVLQLADMWEARADHDLAYAKTIPEEVQESMKDSALELRNRAGLIRMYLNMGRLKKEIG